jgi:predicted lactoylglutathione lyase
MAKMVFINLPVADVAKSTAFHEAMGGKRDPRFRNESSSMVALSDTIHLMLLGRGRFADFTSKQIIEPKNQVQTLIALPADSRHEVDALVEKARVAGGRIDPGPVQDHGFMYGRSYEDPDGHVFEVFWMDVEAALATMNSNAAA